MLAISESYFIVKVNKIPCLDIRAFDIMISK